MMTPINIIEKMAEISQPVLRWPLVRRVRRNHGLEHATIHLLSRKLRNLRVAGRSSANGFILLGTIPTDEVETAARDALNRMKKGERGLAVHPNCGTNLVTIGYLATLSAYLGLGIRRERRFASRFGTVLVLMVLSVIVGQPLGMSLQRHFTTEGDPGDLEVVSVKRREVNLPFGGGQMVVHDVVTSGGAGEASSKSDQNGKVE